MWGATMCMAKCLTSLAQQKDASRTIEALSAVLSWLPDSASACPGFTEWESQWGQCVVEAFNDVHALLTDLNQLQRFRKLPFQAVRAWADSDELVVDSENSVAVALSWWCGGDLGSQATEDQLKVLSGLLRVARLTHGVLTACHCALQRKHLGAHQSSHQTQTTSKPVACAHCP
jgi:hypothetical protein